MKKFLVPILIVIVIAILIVVFTFSGNSSENTTNTPDDNNTVNSGVDNNAVSNNKQPEEISEITVDVLKNYPVTPDSDFKYDYDTFDTIRITRYTGSNSIVVIPEEIGGKTVTAIAGLSDFANDSTVKAVVIPKTVKSLRETFTNNQNLEIVLAEGVENVGESTFLNCANLHTVTLSSNLSEIGWCAFSLCESLTELRIPSTLTKMTKDNEIMAFSFCSNLTIYGEAGSYIETVAKEQGIPFIAE